MPSHHGIIFQAQACIDIKVTVTEHKEIIPHILAAYALSGCGTVAQCCGIGRGTVVKVLKAGNTLPNIGNVMASKAKVVQEATCFMAACYGEKNKPSTMTALRERVWKYDWQSEYFVSCKTSVTPSN